jgi:hypothetical protein
MNTIAITCSITIRNTSDRQYDTILLQLEIPIIVNLIQYLDKTGSYMLEFLIQLIYEL